MQIAIMGSGGVGGYFGARLAEAGNDVAFVARGAHRAAISERGLSIRSPLGDATMHPKHVTDDPREIGPVDIVLFATKLYDTESAGALCTPFIGPDTTVISLQNGVDSEEQLARILGAGHVAGGVTRISAAIAEPGVIAHYSDFATLSFGEMGGHRSARLRAFRDVAIAAGIDASLSDRITVELWEKFILLASMAAVTSVTRLPLGPIRDHPRSRRMMHDAIREVTRVGQARGVALEDDVAERVIDLLERVSPALKASMLVDLERGNRLELEWLSGAVCRMGEELGIDTPVHRVVLAALGPYANGAPVKTE